MKTKILLGTGLLALTLTSCSYMNQETPSQPTTAKMEEKAMTTQKMMDSKETSMEKENMAEITSDDMMKKEETAPPSTDTMKETMKKDEMMKEEVMVKTGMYSEYSADKLSDTQKNVLFFHASWCPACVGANKNFMNSEIPENVNLLKVDYDNSSDLKQKYGVTMQHTFVLVDANGEMIKKWSGSNDTKDLKMRAGE